MYSDALPLPNARSVVLDYLLRALGVTGSYLYAPEPGLPDNSIRVEERGCVLCATDAREPMFRSAVAALAGEQRVDAVLIRIAGQDDDFVRTSVDVSLGLLPGAGPWSTAGLEIWTSAQDTAWFVPPTFGPAVSVSEEGLILEMVPPYATMAQRTAGVLRAAGEIAALLPALVAEPR